MFPLHQIAHVGVSQHERSVGLTEALSYSAVKLF